MEALLGKIVALLFALGLAAFAIYDLIRKKRVHDAIDSVADARVIQVLNLGRGYDGKSQFAITYQVLIEKPFEILVTPTNTPAEVGDKVTVYYEAQDHTNYYFAQRWNIDNRMKSSVTFVIIGVLCVIGSIISFF